MSAAGLKLNPAVAKVASNGQISCLICSTQVKAKVSCLFGRFTVLFLLPIVQVIECYTMFEF